MRPAICYPALADASSLKREIVEGLDIVIVRELTGGVYFGEPKDDRDARGRPQRAVDTQVYADRRDRAHRAGRLRAGAQAPQQGDVAPKSATCMKTGVLWRQVVTRIHKAEYPDVELEHVYADNAAMQLVRDPKQFDVIVTDNLFGDILSDVAAMLDRLARHAAVGVARRRGPETGKRKALYEPVHGSAPDIAGKGLANPIAMIGSFGMALRYSFGLVEAADRLDNAIANVLASGIRTKDIAAPGANAVGTQEMGDAIVKELELFARRNALPRGTRGRHVQRDRRERVARAPTKGSVDGIGQIPTAAETFPVVPRRHDHGRGSPAGRIAIH